MKVHRCREDFLEQRLLALDFDEGITYKEFKENYERYHIIPVFTYKTFSYKKKNERFRAVFLMDETITCVGFAEMMNRLIQKIFPEADRQCTDVARMLYGGKEIIEIHPEAVVKITDVVRAAEDRMYQDTPKNFARDIKKLGEKYDVKVEDGSLCIYEHEGEAPGKGRILQGKYVIICRNGSLGREEREQKSLVKPPEIKRLSGFSREEILKNCKLLRDFHEEDISHEQKFLLFTNLCHIEGGKKLFMDCLGEESSKWKRNWEKDASKYPILKCNHKEGVCPYREECMADSLYDKLKNGIRRIGEPEDYLSVDAVYEALKCTLRECIQEKGELTHVIKAQTAIGKTQAYSEVIAEQKDKKFIVAVPSRNLQEEVCQRLEENGIVCYKTLNLYEEIRALGAESLAEMVQEMYEKGYGKYIRKKVAEFMEERADELDGYQTERLKELLREVKLEKDVRCIVTTHALFMMTNLSMFGDEFEVIIDEDILASLFKENHTIPLSDLEKAIASGIFTEGTNEHLRRLLRMEDQTTCRTDLPRLSEKEVAELYKHRADFSSALLFLFESSTAGIDREKKEMMIFMGHKLPYRKMIILSATADKKLYEDYAGKDRIHFWPLPQAKYKGKLVQYTHNTMSRAFIKKYGEDEVRKTIQEFTGVEEYIGFKMLDGNRQAYFGKAEGINCYKGKDLNIIGTPHSLPMVYKLIGGHLGYYNEGVISTHRIERNGYSFCIMTFKDKDMQNLQLFFLESELEQAVGRARLLRYPCTVYVFSNYPCQQAIIKQENYLEELKLKSKEHLYDGDD